MKRSLLLLFVLSYQLSNATTYFVSPLGNDSNNGSITDPFLTIQAATTGLIAGDTLWVHDGTYAGFDYRGNSGTASDPIVFYAESSGVIINQSGPLRSDGINIEGPDYVVVDGFTVQNIPQPGNGIRVVLSDHVVIRNCVCDNNWNRGIFTGFTDDILIENNVCSNTQDEHGIYVSNSSDRPIIRNNISHNNNNIGIHMNGDLSAGGDGMISDAQVYGNIIYENNLAAGINMDGVVNALVYNNLIYNNHSAQGIALFQIDGATPSTGARIFHNTIIVPSDGRWGILFNNGAHSGGEVLNNIIINQHSFRGSITTTSEIGLTSDFNLLSDKMSNQGDGVSFSLATWQALGLDGNSVIADPLVDLFNNPGANDYSLENNSQAINHGTPTGISDDIEGNPRDLLPDPGAYESSNVLPITLGKELKATQIDDHIRITWSVESAYAAEILILQKKENNLWKDLAHYNINQESETAYAHLDEDPFLGMNYYRLIEIPVDGKAKNIDHTSIHFKNEDSIRLLSNLVSSDLQLIGNTDRINGLSLADTKGNIILIDVDIQSRISLSQLPAGTYFLIIRYSEGHLSRFPFVKAQ